MIKFLIVTGIALILSAVLLFTLFKGYNRINQVKGYFDDPREMPSFTFKTVNNKPLTKDGLPDQKIILIYFNSTCESCKKEIDSILHNYSLFHNCLLVLVSSQTEKELKDFETSNKINNYPKVLLVRDFNSEFSKKFKSVIFPSIFIYNSNKKLVKVFKGETKIKTLVKYAQ